MADCYFTYNIESDTSTLFIPPIDPDEVVWSGLPVSPEEAKERYDVDEVLAGTELNPWLAQRRHESLPIHCLSGEGQVSTNVTFLEFGRVDFADLRKALDWARTSKDEYEVAMLRYANDVSRVAHEAVMNASSKATNEQELEALFVKTCMERGCKEMAYHTIMASGTSAATLHYVHNDASLLADDPSRGAEKGKKPLNILLDGGCEYKTYCADVTRTFPINGSFTKESKEVYELVLKMQKESLKMVKAGMLWDDVHATAHRVAIDGLLSLGVLKGDPKEIFEKRTSVAFFPHGLGHYLGMDTHDVGGFANYKDTDAMFRYLRVRGKVPKGAVITVEPGVYFCRFIIEPYLNNDTHSKFIDKDVLDRYWDVGGVRIEDDVVVTEDGFDNLTTAPKESGEVEKLVQVA